MGEKKKQKKTTKKKAVAKTAAKRVLKNPDETLRISPKATETMVLAADRYMNEVGKTSSALTKHRKSKTIQSQDVHLATRLTFKERYQSKKIEYTKAKNDKARQKAIKKLEEKKRKEKEKEKEKKQNKSLKKRIKGIEKNTKGPQFKHIELLPIKIEASDRNKSWKKIQRDHKKNDPLFTEISKDYRSDVQRLELKYAEINEIAGVTANSEDINKVIEEYNKDVDMLNKNLKYYNIPKEFGKAKRDKRGKRKSEGASEQKSQKEKWGDRAKKRKEWAAKSEEKLEKLREEQRKLGEQLTPEPIKVGHHSEGKHRKLASRMQNLSREISKLEDQKQEHLRKAENLTAMSKTNKGDAKTRADKSREKLMEKINIGDTFYNSYAPSVVGEGDLVVVKKNKKSIVFKTPNGTEMKEDPMFLDFDRPAKNSTQQIKQKIEEVKSERIELDGGDYYKRKPNTNKSDEPKSNPKQKPKSEVEKVQVLERKLEKEEKRLEEAKGEKESQRRLAIIDKLTVKDPKEIQKLKEKQKNQLANDLSTYNRMKKDKNTNSKELERFRLQMEKNHLDMNPQGYIKTIPAPSLEHYEELELKFVRPDPTMAGGLTPDTKNITGTGGWVAKPTQKFWQKWKENKDEMKKKYEVKKKGDSYIVVYQPEGHDFFETQV